MYNVRCIVTNCRSSYHNKMPGVSFHSLPSSSEMRSKWLVALKNKCLSIDWVKNKICSKHFENKFFDAQRQLKNNAVPSLFGGQMEHSSYKNSSLPHTNIDQLLNKMVHTELSADVRASLNQLEEPSNLIDFLTEDLKCTPDAPVEANLWLLIKKQHCLNMRLVENVEKYESHLNKLRENLKQTTASKKMIEKTLESNKFIIKSLQEKQTTLEEQIEILTAVESR